MEEHKTSLSVVVCEHLKKLCLHDFPCGTGSWNRSRFLPQKRRAWRELTPRKEETLSPEEEPTDALLGLACSPHSPWALPEDASAEDRFLRELAIRHPMMINETFFCSYFRSLRVVDKKVSLVDKSLLNVLKLEELLLSANHIKEINAFYLPATLKVLELYGNEITSLECLCAHPPPQLQHLGLGHNKLLGPLENLYVTSDYWPKLVSLDLSFNNLTDLQGMVASLSSLKCLRLLLLQGNPLALVPYYRGFTIDSLPQLCVLDDITVSPSEKYLFRGLSCSGDLLTSEAQLVVTIGNVRGVLDSSVLDPEPGPQGPFITYSYYVTYDFLEDEDNEKKEYGGVLAEIVKPSPMEELAGEEAHEEVPGEVSVASGEVSQTQSQDTMLEESIMSSPSAALQRSESAQELVKLRPRIDPRLFPSPGTVLFSTVRKPWSDIIPCSYEMQHTLKDLVPLKAFLLAGTTVTVVEEKILSWPVGQSPVDHSILAKKSKGEDKKGKEKEEKDKGKDKKDKGEKEPGKEQKGSKKKKEAPKELYQDPPILQVLGSCLVALEPLLAGEPLVSTVCDFGVVRTADSDRLTFLRDSKKTKSKKGQKVLDGGKSKTKLPLSEKRKSLVVMFDSSYQPEPLSVDIQVQLNQCRTAEEALRDLALHGTY